MEVLCGYLEKMGIAADKTYDGDEVLEIFRQSEEFYYDVILMDVHMPGISGYEAVGKIKRKCGFSRRITSFLSCSMIPFII